MDAYFDNKLEMIITMLISNKNTFAIGSEILNKYQFSYEALSDE